jgi:lipoyl synthase
VKTEPSLHQTRKPDWLKVRLPSSPVFRSTKSLIADLHLVTVCEDAQCPNRWECWSAGTATFMIAGERCTRACRFCAVDTGRPFPLDPDEPRRVAEAVKRLKLRYIVLTSVTRDDLEDGAAEHFAQAIRAIHAVDPKIQVEVLTPDFNNRVASLRTVAEAAPEVFAHNLETVERLTPQVRSKARYRLSLEVLRGFREIAPGIATKSGLMLGLGEQEAEIFSAMDDLRAVGVEILTLGQYLQPSPAHLPVVDFVPPDKFEEYRRVALEKGFSHVASGPLVRSSYHAAEFSPKSPK